MKGILLFILGIVAVSLGLLFFPLVIGGFSAWFNFSAGNIGAAIISLVLGIFFQWMFFVLLNIGDLGSDDDCPYCGSGDHDGNHCYTCNDDF